MITEVTRRVADRAVLDRAQDPPPHWGDFVLVEGLLDVAGASGSTSYVDCARSVVDSYLDRGPDWGRIEWQWAGMPLSALRFYHLTGEKRYLDFALAVIDRLQNRTTKTKDGGIGAHPQRVQLWIDLLHFVCPAFCEAALVTGNEALFDAAVEQVRVYLAHMLDEKTGLVYHVWDEETDEQSPCLWARGNGWLSVACVEMLARLPSAHQARSYLLGVLERQLDAVIALQDPSGHWHTVLDRPDSYIETSGAAIFGLAMTRAVRLGLLERQWLGPAKDAWRGLQDKVSDDGLVFDVSTGTPPGDFDHYQRITKGVETYGTGLFLQLGVEMSRL